MNRQKQELISIGFIQQSASQIKSENIIDTKFLLP